MDIVPEAAGPVAFALPGVSASDGKFIEQSAAKTAAFLLNEVRLIMSSLLI